MGWLSYLDDEVLVFHPAFEVIGNDVLTALKLDAALEWIHHDSSATGGIPDYVLREKGSNQWILVVEIKKTRSAVNSSTHYRRQAHSYVLENKNRFRAMRPILYVLTNLEDTQLFGADNIPDLATSPNARQVSRWSHGDFQLTPEAEHKLRFFENLKELVAFSISATIPLTFKLDFPNTWDTIGAVGVLAGADLPQHWSNGTTASWFSCLDEEPSRGLLLAVRCLLAEWIVYQCEQHQHPNSADMLRLKVKSSASKTRILVADSFDRILHIDFEGVIGGGSTTQDLRQLTSKGALDAIEAVVGQLQELKFDHLSDLVGNSGLPDLLFDQLQNRLQRSRRGTVQTDPELAQVAATLGFYKRPHVQKVIDPCAGIGNLLVAAFYEMAAVEQDHRLPLLTAIEIDPVQACLAALQLTMQVPALASSKNQPVVICDSLTNHAQAISSSNLVLLNPPYKRYEDDGDPLPNGYRRHLNDAIEELKGEPASTTGGQADLYNFYIEFVVSAMSDGARGVFILNNKWMSTKTTLPLRQFLVEQCRIEGLIQYPRAEFFEEHLITTSLLVFTKATPKHDDVCRFVRCKEDLRLLGSNAVLGATFEGSTTQKVEVSSHPQSAVTERTKSDPIGSWRTFFPTPSSLAVLQKFPRLVDHFDSVVQGRLERDEVSKIFSFPFRDWRKKGTLGQGSDSRSFIPGPDRHSPSGPLVPPEALQRVTEAVAAIPDNYRGYALKVAHRMGDKVSFVLRPGNCSHKYDDGSSDAVLEPPDLRAGAWARGPNKARWTDEFDAALANMRAHQTVGVYVNLIEQSLGAHHRPPQIVWEDLLRQCAGELILLRAFRSGWRAHLNPLAFNPSGRQVRISSNFYSLRGIRCTEAEREMGKNQEYSKVILAFLVSSFGQIQFEFFGQNREGLRKCEKATCIEKVHIPKPTTVSENNRIQMVELLTRIKCPVSCETHPHFDPNRRELDLIVGAHLLGRESHDLAVLEFVDTVALELDELQRERLD